MNRPQRILFWLVVVPGGAALIPGLLLLQYDLGFPSVGRILTLFGFIGAIGGGLAIELVPRFE